MEKTHLTSIQHDYAINAFAISFSLSIAEKKNKLNFKGILNERHQHRLMFFVNCGCLCFDVGWSGNFLSFYANCFESAEHVISWLLPNNVGPSLFYAFFYLHWVFVVVGSSLFYYLLFLVVWLLSPSTLLLFQLLLLVVVVIIIVFA